MVLQTLIFYLLNNSLPRNNLYKCFSLSVSGAQRAVKIDSGDAIVQRVGAEVDIAHSLLLDVNVTQIFAKIAELGNEFHMFDN
jgi:hypothetical protein